MAGTGTAVATMQEGVGATPVVATDPALTPHAAERQTAPIKLENLNQAIEIARELEAAETTLNELASNGMVVVTDENRLTSTFTKLNKVELREKDASGIIISFGGREIPLDEFILANEITDDQKKEVLQGTAYNENTCFVAGAVKGESGQVDEEAKKKNESVLQALERLSSPLEGNGTDLTKIDPILVFSNRGYCLEVPQQTPAESAQPVEGVVNQAACSGRLIDAPTAQELDSASVTAANPNNQGRGDSEQSDNVAQSGAGQGEGLNSLAAPASVNPADQFGVPEFVRKLAEGEKGEIEDLFRRLSPKQRVAALEALGELKKVQSKDDTEIVGHAEKVGTVGMLAVWNQVVKIHEIQHCTDSASADAASPDSGGATVDLNGDAVDMEDSAVGATEGLVARGRRWVQRSIDGVKRLVVVTSAGGDIESPTNNAGSVSLSESSSGSQPLADAEPLADPASEAADAVASKDSGPAEQGEPGAGKAQNRPSSEALLEYFSGLISRKEWFEGLETNNGLGYCRSVDKQFCLPDCGLLYEGAEGIDCAQLYKCYQVLVGSEGEGFGLTKLCEVEPDGNGVRVTQKGTLYLPQGHKLLQDPTSPTA